MTSVYQNSYITPILRSVTRFGLRISGWKVDVAIELQAPFVFIGAPHTSNWDFMLMLAAVLELGLDVRWLGKNSLFSFPFRSLMLWLGGIPVDRSKPNSLVADIVAQLRQNPTQVLCVPPEGTRGKVTRWKTGFYHIAHSANIPVVMTVIDAQHKCIRVLGVFHPSGDAEQEIPQIQEFYRGYKGIRPANAFEPPPRKESE